MSKKDFSMFGGLAVGFIVVIAVLIVIFSGGHGKVSENATLEDLVERVDYTESELKKGQMNIEGASLYDELPSIDKYPLIVEGKGDKVIEIFSSPEKSDTKKDYDSWLIDVANKFNEQSDDVQVSVRKINSGLGADYIISGKYKPDMFSPSSELWGAYIDANGGKLETISSRLVGNVAGVVVSKEKGIKNIDDFINQVKSGKINVGYTNPQESTTGMNLLMEILKKADNANMFSDTAKESFSSFQNNIPYVAYDTIQLKNSATNGKLDGFVVEYQSYVNEKSINSIYDFIPFGVRHDNPVYMCKKDNEAECRKFIEFCLSEEMQQLANKKGFNGQEKYKSSYDLVGSELVKALSFFKENKDSGKEVIAVFVADRSGSMSGEAIEQLKQSLSNGVRYINSNNQIGLVSYSSNVTIDVPLGKVDMNQMAYIQGALDNMEASGGTSSYDACIVGLDMIKKAKEKNPNATCMLFLLSDGDVTGGYSLSDITNVVRKEEVPIYTIGYGSDVNKDELKKVSEINEAASISADSDDVIYKIKSLFNSNL